MGLREKQTLARRERILAAARALIRRSGGTAFSMKALAEAAEVSLATPYNLFGSKGGVLYALLNDSLDRVDDAIHGSTSKEPMERVLEVAGLAASVYANDASFYRPLMQFLLGVRDLSHRPRFLQRSVALWDRTVQAASRHGVLAPSTDGGLLARQLMINFAGVLELWIHEELDDQGLRDQILYGSTLLLLGSARPAARARLVRRLETVGRGLPRTLAIPAESSRAQRPRRKQKAA
jgi:AcrR family transcriptional regulator